MGERFRADGIILPVDDPNEPMPVGQYRDAARVAHQLLDLQRQIGVLKAHVQDLLGAMAPAEETTALYH